MARVELGKVNRLQVVKGVDFGIYLDGDEDGEILMPTRYVPEGTQPQDWIDAFIYLDSEDRLIATTERPYAEVGDFAFLKVGGVNSFGAFVEWGLPKDILVPFREQKVRMIEGNRYVVYIYEDSATGRIVASSKFEKFLDKTPPSYEIGEKVDLMIYQRTELGYKAVINQKHSGVLYYNEIFQPIAVGQKIEGYINRIREDHKIDLILNKPGYEKIGDLATQILNKLKEQGGFLAVTDKSESEEIYEIFRMSKKSYKKAVGDLYKRRLVALESDGIRLLQ